MDTLLDHSAEAVPIEAIECSQSQLMSDQPAQLPSDAFLDTSIMGGEIGWDFRDNAEWARVTGEIFSAPSPMEDELPPLTSILDAGASTSVAIASRMQLCDIGSERKLPISDKTLRFDPGPPVPRMGAYTLLISIRLQDSAHREKIAHRRIAVGVVSVPIPLLISRSCLRRM